MFAGVKEEKKKIANSWRKRLLRRTGGEGSRLCVLPESFQPRALCEGRVWNQTGLGRSRVSLSLLFGVVKYRTLAQQAF